jgi:RimJ/RimL family protein N-acetyltransferase
MSTPLHIRNLRPEDAEAWAVLRREALERYPLAFGATLRDVEQLAEMVRERLASPECSVVFGAYDAVSLVGILGIARETRTKERHKSLIWGLYVTPEHRRRGVGELLLHAAIRQARTWDGVEQVSLSVTETAAEAMRLYERNGFQLWGREPRALHWEGRYVDEIHMVLELGSDVQSDPAPKVRLFPAVLE